MRGSYRRLPKILEPETCGKDYERDLENSSMEEEF